MSAFDRLTSTVAALVAHLTARFDYHAQYPATVLGQNADGTLELKPDDPRFGPGVSSVRIRLGLPGVSVTIKTPSRVLLSFEGGDPTKAIATLWDTSSLDTITLTAATSVNVTTPGSVSVNATGSGTIHLVCATPGGIVLGDGSGNEAPIARVGDLVTMSGGGVISGSLVVNLPSGPVPATFAPGAALSGQFTGFIQGGSMVAFAD